MPSLDYRKRDFFVRGLDVVLTANYNKNMTNNVDTSSYEYNWRGEMRPLRMPVSNLIRTPGRIIITGTEP